MKKIPIMVLVLILGIGLASSFQTQISYDKDVNDIKLNILDNSSYEISEMSYCIKEVRGECRRYIKEYNIQGEQSLKLKLQIDKSQIRDRTQVKVQILGYDSGEGFIGLKRNYFMVQDTSRGLLTRAYSKGEFSARVIYTQHNDLSKVSYSNKITKEHNTFKETGEKNIGVIISQGKIGYYIK